MFYIISVNIKRKGFHSLGQRQCQHLKLVNSIPKKIKPLFSCLVEGEGKLRQEGGSEEGVLQNKKILVCSKSSPLFSKQNVKLPINILVAGARSIFSSSPIECCSSNFTHKNIIIGKCKISSNFKVSNSKAEKNYPNITCFCLIQKAKLANPPGLFVPTLWLRLMKA